MNDSIFQFGFASQSLTSSVPEDRVDSEELDASSASALAELVSSLTMFVAASAAASFCAPSLASCAIEPLFSSRAVPNPRLAWVIGL